MNPNHLVELKSNDELAVIHTIKTKKALLNLRAINHKLRLQILQILDENKGITVTDIFIKLRIEQSVASQHLAALRRAGFVKTIRKGKFIYYSVNYERVILFTKLIEQMQ
ncbi:MAG: ArsR/SmtB family transcription factor [Chitinophagaceae bacterium]